MRNKKSKAQEPSPEQSALERRVDEMMDVKFDPSTAPVAAEKPTISKPSGPVTAPELPKQLLKDFPAEPTEKIEPKLDPVKPLAPIEPLKIDKLDEMSAEVESEDSDAESAKPAKQEDKQETSNQTDDTLAADEALDDSIDIDDVATDQAVDEIEAGENGTTNVAPEVAATVVAQKPAEKPPQPIKTAKKSGNRLKRFFKNKWTWITAAAILIAVFAIPTSRYAVLGLFIKKNVAVEVRDSKTNTPVSGALVSLAGSESKTDGSGKAIITAKVGQSTLSVTKKYYISSNTKYMVSLASNQSSKIRLVATGRLVPITVVNGINAQPVSGAQLRLAGTTAKTDKKGRAVVALGVKLQKVKATLSAPGYNSTAVEVTVTDQVLAANKYSITPSGKVFFLSNQSGTVDVVKANLDGSERKIVLAGTGKEDKSSTVLLASSDWKFLVLRAKREAANAGLYLIDTSNDKVTPFDNTDAGFNLIGWHKHNFIYEVAKNNQPLWQTGHQQLKSYDADNSQLNQLDQAVSEGDQNSYAYQSLGNYYIADDLVVYSVQWQGGSTVGTPNDLAGKSDIIRGIQPNGQGKKDYQTFPSNSIGIIQANLSKPQLIYYAVPNRAYSQTTYFQFENQSVKPASTVDQASFSQTYPTYLLSPSSNQTFWADLRDGKNALFVGNAEAKNAKQIASLSDFTAYGWFSENYLLLSKNGSELYIIPVAGLKSGQQPIKITDYYKPAQTYSGYGYGGL